MPKIQNKIVPALIILLVIASFFLGSMYTKVKMLEKGNTASKNTGDVAGQQAAEPSPKTFDIKQIKDVFNKSKIKLGDANSKLIFIEISDPSCPYCSIASGQNGQLNKQVGDRFTLVADGGTYVAPVPEMKKLVDAGKAAFAYIYTPGHGNGEMGMKALYCAFSENKFWQAEELLMSSGGYDLLNNTVKNDKTKSQDVATFLASVVDPVKMKNCIDTENYDKTLTDDIALAESLGVTGTPGFFVNTTAFAGAYNYKDMKAAVNAALGK